MNAKNMYAGTQTEKNLWEAFAGESQARNKYTYFASVAKKQGYEQIAALFLKTAENEKEHAKLWFKELREFSDTEKNLKSAAEAKTTNGRLCTKILPRQPRRKAFTNLRNVSARLPRSNSFTRSVSVRFSAIFTEEKCLRRTKSRCGNAAIAGMSL